MEHQESKLSTVRGPSREPGSQQRTWSVGPSGSLFYFCSISEEVKEKSWNSLRWLEGMSGSSMGVSVGSSCVKSGSKLLTSSVVFWGCRMK